MDKIFLCHTHYIPSFFRNQNIFKLGASIIPEYYPNLIYSYYNDINYFRSIIDFIKYFKSKQYGLYFNLYSIENINMIDDIKILSILKHYGLCSIQLYHHSNNNFFDIRSGFTEYGKKLLQCLLNEDIALDLSHLNDYWINKILNNYTGRVTVSHCAISNIIDTSDNRENTISVKTLELLQKRESLIGISFVNDTVSFTHNESSSLNVYNDIIKQILYVFNHGGFSHICIGPDYFDTEYFSKVYKQKIFIPECFYSIDGYKKFYSDIKESTTKEFVDNFFWNNAVRFYQNDLELNT